MQFLSDNWMEDYEKALKKHFSPEKTTTRVSVKIAEVFRNVPEGGDKWMSIEWEDGAVIEFCHGKGAETAPRDADFTFSGEYESWIRMLSLKDDMVNSIMSGKVVMRGNMRNFQPAMKPFVGAILLQGAVRPRGNVILRGLLRKGAVIVDRKMFS